MGMAASQGRLLFMTARISNNEFEQQCVAYSKQRLADDSQQANDQYLDALQETQYQIITGYNGDTAQYEAVSYNILTGFNNVASSKQYIVSDNVGRIIVSDSIAQAFENSKHNYNAFLETVESGKGNYYTQVAETDITEGMVHDAWDRYLASVNRGVANGLYDDDPIRHAVGFSFNANNNSDPTADYVTYNTTYLQQGDRKIYLNKDDSDQYYYNNYKLEVESYIDGDGNTQYSAFFYANEDPQQDEKFYLNDTKVTPDGNGGYTFEVLNPDGSTKATIKSTPVSNVYVEKKDFDFSGDDFLINLVHDSSQIVSPTATASDTNVIFFEGATHEQRQLYDYAMAISKKFATQYNATSKLTYDADKVQYYKNIFDEMTTKGYTTYTKMIADKYINTEANDEVKPFASDEWLIRHVKQGKFVLSFFSTTDQQFIKTTLDDDESIVNKENKQKMAIAEQVYQTHMDRIQAEDKRFDMELTKLESEHTALLTEYDSVAKVISKNVEKSFGIFNA